MIPAKIKLDQGDGKEFDEAIEQCWPQDTEDETQIITKVAEKLDGGEMTIVLIKHVAVIDGRRAPQGTVISARQFIVAAEAIAKHHAIDCKAPEVVPETDEPVRGSYKGVGWEAAPCYVVTCEAGEQVGISADSLAIEGVAKGLIDKLLTGN